MTDWVRFKHQGNTGFGTLMQSEIIGHDGDMFDGARPSGQLVCNADQVAISTARSCSEGAAPAPFLRLEARIVDENS
jgi:hypothetical protein